MSYEAFKAEQDAAIAAINTSLESETPDVESIKNAISEVISKQDSYGKTQYDKKQGQIKKFEDILATLGIDKSDDTTIKEYAEKFKQEREKIDESKTENQKLMEKIERLETLEREREEEATKLKTENDRSKITEKLNKALEGKFMDVDSKIKVLLYEDALKVVDGDILWKDGESTKSFDKGLESFLKANEKLLLSNQNPGLKTVKPKTAGASDSSLTLEEINKMTPEQIKENLAAIKKAAGSR